MPLDQIKQEALRDPDKDKNFGKGPAYYRCFLYMPRCVTVQRTRQDSVQIAETYIERFSCWSSRMKTLMRSFVYWPKMDKNTENAVKLCKGCALAAKAPPIKFNPGQKLTFHGLGYTLTALARQFLKVARSTK